MRMTERQAEIADLYYRSNTIQFGEGFALSIHKDNPGLPLSPWYMHYPAANEPGSELLPELYDHIGDEFYEMCERANVQPVRIAGLPRGAQSLGETFAKRYDTYPDNLLQFDKIDDPEHGTTFVGPQGEYVKGDELVPVDDHTSGARNKFRFLRASQAAGLVVSTILIVVDRQQGGVERLRDFGVSLYSIHTGDSLLQFGLKSGYIDEQTVKEVQDYRRRNQL